jgi:hypothetical protein
LRAVGGSRWMQRLRLKDRPMAVMLRKTMPLREPRYRNGQPSPGGASAPIPGSTEQPRFPNPLLWKKKGAAPRAFAATTFLVIQEQL